MTVPDIGVLRSLRDRVAVANGPDRGLDYAIQETIVRKLALRSTVARFSESLDAAVALVERVLPGYARSLGHNWSALRGMERSSWRFMAELHAPPFEGVARLSFEGKAPTEALAVMLALLSALIAQREHDVATPAPEGADHG